MTAGSTVLSGTAIVVGMGEWIGPAIARRLVAAGMQVALVSRTEERMNEVTNELRERGGLVRGYVCDVTEESAVRRLLNRVTAESGTPNLMVYGVQGWFPGSFLATDVAAFEEAWRANCLGAFMVARACAHRMIPAGTGSMIFLGSTSGTVGRSGFLNLAVGKFSLRAMTQVMARELGPLGIHVVHCIIDGDVTRRPETSDDAWIDPDDLATQVLQLHLQPRSAWTSELDMRPFNEAFWQHC